LHCNNIIDEINQTLEIILVRYEYNWYSLSKGLPGLMLRTSIDASACDQIQINQSQ